MPATIPASYFIRNISTIIFWSAIIVLILPQTALCNSYISIDNLTNILGNATASLYVHFSKWFLLLIACCRAVTIFFSNGDTIIKQISVWIIYSPNSGGPKKSEIDNMPNCERPSDPTTNAWPIKLPPGLYYPVFTVLLILYVAALVFSFPIRAEKLTRKDMSRP